MALPMKTFGCQKHISSCVRLLFRKTYAPASCRLLCTKSDGNTNNAQLLDGKLLEYLVCPLTKTPLRYDKEAGELISDSIGVAFPIVNGIPNLVPQDGRIINPDKHNQSKK